MSKKGEVKSLREKLIAISKVRSGKSKASVAREMHVPESTLRGWCKNQQRIFSQALAESTGECSTPAKRTRYSNPSCDRFRSNASYATSSRSSTPQSEERVVLEPHAVPGSLNLSGDSAVSDASQLGDTPMDLTTRGVTNGSSSTASGSSVRSPVPQYLYRNFWTSYKMSMDTHSHLSHREVLETILRNGRDDLEATRIRAEAVSCGSLFLNYLVTERPEFVTSDELFILQELLTKLRSAD
ncbi:hypothetical protein GWI33_005571 [Rhynchophorus ferrugineus]|uniref:HTH psq-type domain-containing protein n=1 Tax=Rhynchophorus ferrugineus TaxID=354439 RepID=A0A834IJ36_RHYFE|nr:hypothetical protein GWI33_005571 [Rhynchophorus ferrugineus]